MNIPKRAQELADVAPVEPSSIKFSDSEATFYEDHAAELNWLMVTAFRAMDSGLDGMAGAAISDFGKYVFRMGRAYEREEMVSAILRETDKKTVH